MRSNIVKLLTAIILIALEACGSATTLEETAAKPEPAEESAAVAVAPEPEPEPKWMTPHRKVTEKKDAMIRDMEEAHKILTARAKVEDPELLTILQPEAPKPRKFGYGILPEITESGPYKEIQPQEMFYYIRWLETTFDPEYAKARELRNRANNEPKAALKPMVDEYDRLKKRLNHLESLLSYHLQWQKSVVDHPAFFANKNKLVAKIRTVIKYKGDMDALRRDILSQVAPFKRTPGLKIVTQPDGSAQLDVPVHTDIADEAFLSAFKEAIETEYNASQAAQSKHFRLNLIFHKVDAQALYPEGVPQRGAQIDVDNHLSRFPKDALILTTGGKGLHAVQSKHIVLGPDPISKRVMAHEFGHLLGFNDAYLRGYDGNPDDPYGATIVEWTGLYNDLMGSPGGGKVSEQMIDVLMNAYGK